MELTRVQTLCRAHWFPGDWGLEKKLANEAFMLDKHSIHDEGPDVKPEASSYPDGFGEATGKRVSKDTMHG